MRTHARRVQTLLDNGFTQKMIDRIHSPVGIYLGGHCVEDIALSVLAQVVAAKNGISTRKKNTVEMTTA